MAEEGNHIVFIPAYEDFVNQINSLFTPNITSGITFSYVYSHPIKVDKYEIEAQSNVNVALGPILIQRTQFGYVPNIQRQVSTSASANMMNVGVFNAQYANGTCLLNIIGVPTPFVLTGLKLAMNENEFLGLISINARQQISNITARFQFTKFEVPIFTEATAIFGSIRRAIGFRFQNGNSDDKKNQYQILARYSTQKSIFQSDISFIESLKNDFIVSAAVKKTAARGLTFGAQFKISKKLEKELILGWDFKIGKSRIQSFLSSNMIVSSSLAREFSKGMVFEITTALDHKNKDALLGFNVTLMQ
ncbi:hypothetical protein TRFO_41433 [Tritrichomonas foetus]|uniref:Eukaryotic porin family protein n=1 Tax=Tritrichomonas foetus TaxID=1144522 RepID=A0A1J4L4V4_9EUKA|nr:hypothetical protein TRFO_41433 [Tritrichomonas foetus]|eukprot:OHT16965.1 hypothetical protein TRFO_41433 [Tritrichomonas foetus]